MSSKVVIPVGPFLLDCRASMKPFRGLAMLSDVRAQRIAAVRMVDLFENQIRVKAFQSRSENFKPSIRQSSWP
jgi:hypothetical protein